jgi:hypothetical protein
MAVQFPQLNDQEQAQRYEIIAKNTLFPYSYPFIILPNAGGFNHVSPISFASHYFTVAMQADNNFAISAIDFQYSGVIDNTTTRWVGFFGVEISYSPIPATPLSVNATPPAIPTPVQDIGNIIYRNITYFIVPTGAPGLGNDQAVLTTVDDFRRYEPYNYLLKYNQLIYMHFFIDDTTLSTSVNTSFQGIVLFHTLVTGLKI